LKFELLSRLWLHEPDGAGLARAVSELGLPSADPAELALAYADVFLLNVYPYGTAFADPAGELNGPEAQQIAALYEAHGYCPAELKEVGAPDHLGLCLGFWAYFSSGQASGGSEAPSAQGPGSRHDSFLADLLNWAPLCCLAVEREPSVHAFYRALAARTREALLTELQISNFEVQVPNCQSLTHEPPFHPSSLSLHPPEEEIGLRDVVRFLLTPAQCGLFLSRSRLGQIAVALGLHLPFGSRFDVAEMLFMSAGEEGKVEPLLAQLETELDAWAQAYRGWGEEYPAWRPSAGIWLARTEATRGLLAEMRQAVQTEAA